MRSSGRPRPAPSLAEREGLYGKLCFPDLMRGVLSWRDGDWEAAAKSLPRAPTSSASRSAAPRSPSTRCTGWRSTLRERGDLSGAETELARALDICERAGLIAQSRRGDLGPRRRPRARGPRRAGPGRGRGGGPARRAAALPGRRGRHGGGRRSVRGRSRRTRRDGSTEAREPLAGARPPARRRPLPVVRGRLLLEIRSRGRRDGCSTRPRRVRGARRAALAARAREPVAG